MEPLDRLEFNQITSSDDTHNNNNLIIIITQSCILFFRSPAFHIKLSIILFHRSSNFSSHLSSSFHTIQNEAHHSHHSSLLGRCHGRIHPPRHPR